jgi:hypothetical protein
LLVGTVNLLVAPAVVMRPMSASSVNHTAPSGPETIDHGSDPGAAYSVTTPEVVMRPILLA